MNRRARFSLRILFAISIISLGTWCAAFFGSIYVSERLLFRFARTEHENLLSTILEQNQAAFSINDGYQVTKTLRKLAQRNGLLFVGIVDSRNRYYASSDAGLHDSFSASTLFENQQFSSIQYRSNKVPCSGRKFFHSGLGEEVTLLVVGGNQGYLSIIEDVRTYLNSIFFFGFVILTGVVFVLVRRGLKPLERLSELVAARDPAKRELIVMHHKHQDEITDLRDAINEAIRKIYSLEDALKVQLRKSIMGEIASQVAHDIRSPLAALESAIGGEVSSSERTELVRVALGRIRDISNRLIQQNRNVVHADSSVTNAPEFVAESSGESELTVNHILSLIISLVAEKRGEFATKQNICIDLKCNGAVYALFAKVDRVDVSRVLSNLLNNAAEACDEKSGLIEIGISAENEDIIITVVDNGKGISPSLLPMLCGRGVTFGKKHGSGLGLYHAKTCVESWGGSFVIESELAQGTRVVIKIPKSETPRWFLRELRIATRSIVVIYDDEIVVHEEWKRRLAGECEKASIQIMSYVRSKDLKTWVLQEPWMVERAVFLMDFDNVGDSAESGLDLIENLGLHGQAVLVTNRFDDGRVIEMCERMSVPLLPKPLLKLVPVVFEVS